MIGRLISGAITGSLIGVLIGAAITALMLLGPGLKRPPLSPAASEDAMRFLAYMCVRLAADCAVIGAAASVIAWWELVPDSSRPAINAGALTGAILGVGYGVWVAHRELGVSAFAAECLFWGIANAIVGAIVGAYVAAPWQDRS